ncbi:hypothetical protein PPL_10851 [Heterostelium album PN500]|uniref:Ankyrin repeat protein n=1 Tax=Heterostelium pallidum (strain ATCC 26659 / Pp 5 / PN500) TaxID=670386 RepID=D3BS59_HETP5|nr:hypothetical protein PPL_10851 [Heterostelium album PN500]EFA75796.1 hypothetical protein PPL_10851 [Heterostelium album PN500]|eukprot:XP_020427930.1 hypothetical protein PPL_10851 [Heterostelium album PN500]
MTYLLLKKILNSVVLSNKIFRYVKDIHDQLVWGNGLRCDWYDLGCFPDLLIRFNYIERYKQIFNKIVERKRNNNNSIADESFLRIYYESFTNALLCGDIDVIILLYHEFHKQINFNRVLFREHYQSNLALIEFLHENCDYWFKAGGKGTMDDAAFGSLEVIQFLHYNRTEGCSKQALDNAASSGDMDLIKFLHFNRTEGCTTKIYERTIMFGQLNVVKWLLENRTEAFTQSAIHSAVHLGHLEIVKTLIDSNKPFLCKKNCKLCNNTTTTKTTTKTTLKYHITEDSTLSSKLFEIAISYGHLAIVRYFNENFHNVKCSTHSLNSAASRGYLETIKYIYENRIERCSEQAIEDSIRNGHLETLVFLNQTIDANLQDYMHLTVSYTQFDILKYIHQQSKIKNPGFKFQPFLMDPFVTCKDSTKLDWLKENTTFGFSVDAYNLAIYYGNVSTLRWLHENTAFAIPDDAFETACCQENAIEKVRYLHEQGATCTTEAMDLSKSIKVTSFLHYNRTEGCTSQAMSNAITSEKIEIIKFLDQNRTEHLNSKPQLTDQYFVLGQRYNIALNFLERLKLIKEYKI